MKKSNKLNAVNPSAKNPSAVSPCGSQVEALTEKILDIVHTCQKNERVYVKCAELQSKEIHDLRGVLGMREARVKRLEAIIDGEVTDWHKIRDWFLLFATVGQFAFIVTHLI